MPETNDGWPADAAFPQHEAEPDGTEYEGLPDEPEPEPEPEPEQPVPAETESTGTKDEGIEVFDLRVREDFEGLLFLGKLEHTFKWAGHEFTIRTLRVDEVLEVGLMAKPYRGTVSEMKAYQAAVVAACTVSVDGQPMPVPITDDVRDTPVANKFRYVLRSWFPPVLDKVYEEYLQAEDRVNKVLATMEKAYR